MSIRGLLIALGLAGSLACLPHLQTWLLPRGEARPVAAEPELGSITLIQPNTEVLITGAVIRPGVYRLPKGSLNYDLVQRAGGLTPNAHLPSGFLNRVVPEAGALHVPNAETLPATSAAPVAATTAAPPAGLKLDLSRATEAELDTLPGIGPGLAKKIVAWRAQNGGVLQLADLDKIPGIGEKRFARLKQALQ